MKSVRFLGDSLKCLREFPRDARQDAGRQLDRVQRGLQPDDFKPMASIGRGVEEIRVWDEVGTFRVIYLARPGRRGLRPSCFSEENAGHGEARHRHRESAFCSIDAR